MVLLSLLGLSCVGADKASKVGQTSVEEFRSQWRDRKYKEIYLDADKAFRESVSEIDFIAFCNKTQAQLGDVERYELIEDRVHYSEAGTLIILRYQTKFLRGKASEQLAWILNGEEAHLYNYALNINVPASGDNSRAGANETLTR